jgi:hypothetical protein
MADLIAWKAELDDEVQRTEQHLQEMKRKAKMLEIVISLIDRSAVKPQSVGKNKIEK